MTGLRRTRAGRGAVATAAFLALLALLGGCTPARPGPGFSGVPLSPGPSASPRATAQAPPSPPPAAQAAPRHWRVIGGPAVLATGLAAPWSIAMLPDGSALISERDSGRVLERTPDGALRLAGTVPGVVHLGEGGLLGLAVRPGDPGSLYAYLTTASDNRVVRMPLSGEPGARGLGAPRPVLAGLPRASFHNGGRIGFGPDGMLYVTAGDAGDRPAAQDRDYLGGKILRLTPEGATPADNPFPGSPVWSYGHRNPQGIGWAPDGTMWASEFGQDTWDELNVIREGQDYGWPLVEGIGHRQGYADPVAQWSTDEASPSGIAVVDATIFIAGLGGRRLWIADADAGGRVATRAQFADAVGRIRDVVRVAPDTLWLLTNNTDGRGAPRAGDDRLLQLTISPAD